MAKTKKVEWHQIGVVGVDSGQVMLCDPCYLDSQWKRSRKNEILEIHDVYSDTKTGKPRR